jgi:hypothetical protein
MKDGGSAFPQHGWSNDPATIERMKEQGGMSLRDWFAGQALIGLLSNTSLQDSREPDAVALGPAWFAEQAGIQADAMIDEREAA